MTRLIDAIAARDRLATPGGTTQNLETGDSRFHGHGVTRWGANTKPCLSTRNKRPMQTCFVGVPADLTQERAFGKPDS